MAENDGSNDLTNKPSRRASGDLSRSKHRPNIVVRHFSIPASSWGFVIGKGGETLRNLQTEFGVRVKVPRPDAAPGSEVTVSGLPEACDRCGDRIQQMVHQMSRGEAKQKPKAKPKLKASAANQSFFPAECTLCDKQLGSLDVVFSHLCSALHLQNLQDHLSDPSARPAVENDIMSVCELLAKPKVHDLHDELGFDVASLANAAPHYIERRMAAKALQEQVQKLRPDFEWLRVQDRWHVRWDESPDPSGTKSMLLAPLLEDILLRCHLDKLPPLARIPKLPAPLPKLDPKVKKNKEAKARHKWPFEPTSRLGIAVILKRGLLLQDFDLICGTSLIKALSGDTSRAKDTYYLQRYCKTICCLHKPAALYTADDAGHAVETLLCGAAGKDSSFYTSSTLCIGRYRLLVTSEVDACNDSGDVIELKSSSKKMGMAFVDSHVALQVAINGSRFVFGCSLDSNKINLIGVEQISSTDGIHVRSASFTSQGQRVMLLLERIFSDASFDHAASSTDMSCIMELTFDDIKAPVIKPAGKGVAVLPEGIV